MKCLGKCVSTECLLWALIHGDGYCATAFRRSCYTGFSAQKKKKNRNQMSEGTTGYFSVVAKARFSGY